LPYAPPGNQVGSPGLSHQATVYYDKVGLDQLLPMLRFAQVCSPKPLPKNSGRTIQWYRFDVPVANTVPSVDGVIGTPVPLTSATLSSTVEEYNDFTSDSRLLEDTDIADFVSEMVRWISTRAALSVDTLARTEIESNSSALVATESAYFTALDIRGGISDLQALNIMPFSDGEWRVIIHPYIQFDLQSDNTAGGFIDAAKYAAPGRMLDGEIGKIAGARVLTTTRVGTSGSVPNVLYNAYIFGAGGFGMVDLMGNGPSVIADPKNERFSVKVSSSPAGGSPFDPAGTLGTFVAYRFVTAFKTLDSTNVRVRIPQADASRV